MRDKPNIIVLTIDCLRYDFAPPTEKSRVLAPNLYRLAKKSLVFTKAFSNGSYTLPSFVALFTSTYPLMYGKPSPFNVQSSYRILIPEVLRIIGYKTALFHSNAYLFPFEKKFDYFEDVSAFTRKPKIDERKTFSIRKYLVDKVRRKITSIMLDFLNTFSKSEIGIKIRARLRSFAHKYAGKALQEQPQLKALEWIKKNRETPFFVWIHFMQLHPPYYLPEEFQPPSLSLTDILSISYKSVYMPYKMTQEDLTILRKIYESEVKYVDYLIGDFLKKLEEEKNNDYILVVTADHGEELGEHGGVGHGHSLYDELLHVPLLIHIPDYEKGKIINRPVSHIDLLPTIIDLLGIKPSILFQGKSLMPLIENEQDFEEEVISENFSEESIFPRMYSLRKGEWKIILSYLPKNEIKVELYNLRKDPGEKRNLWNDSKELGKEFLNKLMSHIVIEHQSQTPRNKIRAKIQKIKYLKKLEQNFQH